MGPCFIETEWAHMAEEQATITQNELQKQIKTYTTVFGLTNGTV